MGKLETVFYRYISQLTLLVKNIVKIQKHKY
jgi:hypothetical protein